MKIRIADKGVFYCMHLEKLFLKDIIIENIIYSQRY